MILVFDLDDTLYPEITYVKSGIEEVSIFLHKDFELDKHEIYLKMLSLLKRNGRGKIFNDILDEYGIYSNKNLKKCISVYRKHSPHIHLYGDAKRCINRFKNLKKYIITDGNIIVQRNKINSLRLVEHFEKIIPTYQYGITFSKPSVKCFKKILNYEKIKPHKMVYIGDNPYKDFVNIKKLGIRTIRIKRGAYKNIVLDKKHEADYMLKNLDQISKKFIRMIDENR